MTNNKFKLISTKNVFMYLMKHAVILMYFMAVSGIYY